MTKNEAEAAVDAVRKAKRVVGVGYNRRFHPEMIKLRDRIRAGELGTILHVEATMTFPERAVPAADGVARQQVGNAARRPDADGRARDRRHDLSRAARSTTSIARASRASSQNDTDDTTSMLFRMKDGMSGYLGTMTTTGPGFSFQVFGSKGWLRLEGVTHVAGASSEERRTRLFGTCKFQPVEGPRRPGRPSGSTSSAPPSRRSPARSRAARPSRSRPSR